MFSLPLLHMFFAKSVEFDIKEEVGIAFSHVIFPSSVCVGGIRSDSCRRTERKL